jgi:hypothetical protein
MSLTITSPIISALKKLSYLELPKSSRGYFKPLLDPGHSGSRIETAFMLEEVAATSTKLGTVRYTRGRARVAPAAL